MNENMHVLESTNSGQQDKSKKINTLGVWKFGNSTPISPTISLESIFLVIKPKSTRKFS